MAPKKKRSLKDIEDEFIHLYGFIQCFGSPFGPSATKIGFHDYDHHLFIATKANLGKVRRGFDKITRDIEKLDQSHLDYKTKLRANELPKRLKSIWLDLEWNIKSPAYYLRGIGEGTQSLVNCYYLPKKQRVANIIRRLRLTKRLLDSSKIHVKKTSQLHVDVARQLGSNLIDFFNNYIPEFVEDVPVKTRNQVIKEARKTALEIGKYVKYLEQIKPGLPVHIPLSRQEYERTIHEKFGFDIGVDELKQMAIDASEFWGKRLEELSQQISPGEHDWKVAKEKLLIDYPKTDEAVIDAYRKTVASNQQRVRESGVVTMPPGEKVRVLETPKWARMFYGPATLSCWPDDLIHGKSASTLIVTPSVPGKDPDAAHREHYLSRLIMFVAHECYPGHHVHYSNIGVYARGVAKYLSRAIGTVIEGWSMYSETLADEIGLYALPQKFAMTEKIHWRAVATLVDIKLHSGEMTYDESVNLLMERVGLTRDSATAETNAHLLEPGNKPKYLYGRATVLSLRDQAKAELGEKYSHKWFHDIIVQSGEITISGLKELMKHEIEEKKKN